MKIATRCCFIISAMLLWPLPVYSYRRLYLSLSLLHSFCRTVPQMRYHYRCVARMLCAIFVWMTHPRTIIHSTIYTSSTIRHLSQNQLLQFVRTELECTRSSACYMAGFFGNGIRSYFSCYIEPVYE